MSPPLQHAVMVSHVKMVAEPLERAGHIVRAFVVHDHRVCKSGFLYRLSARQRNASSRVYLNDSPEPIDALKAALGQSRVAAVAKIPSVKDQPDSIKKTLDYFLSPASARSPADAASAFDYLIVTRYDVKLLSPILSWPCYGQPHQLSVASKCEQSAWLRFNCVADHFWIVPRELVPRYGALIGTRLNLSHYSKCCFAKRCIQKAGHGCYNVFSHHLGDEEQAKEYRRRLEPTEEEDDEDDAAEEAGGESLGERFKTAKENLINGTREWLSLGTALTRLNLPDTYSTEMVQAALENATAQRPDDKHH